MKVSLYILVVVLWTQSVTSQESCRVFTTCAECISSTLACAWCDDRSFYITPNGIRPLCDNPKALLEANCPASNIVNPKSNPPVAKGNTLQLNPSKYEIRLRTQTVQNVTIQVTPQRDFPLDLYILMDVSNTMSAFLRLAQDAAGDILSAVNNLTSDSRLGFGTFVEKRVQPFINPNDPEHSADTFQNVQPLTTNLTQFQNNINTVTTVKNQDTPEAALDALVQSMVCQDVIEWRGKFDALRMVLLMTDAEFHYALDDKLAGIVTPNDLQCRMSQTSGEGVRQQFPSYAQIVRTVLEENFVLIFSVDADVRDLYSLVSNIIYSSNRTNAAALLSSQLSDLINLITQSYTESSTTVVPVLISRDSHVLSLLSLSTCDDPSDELVCRNVSYNTSAEYSVELTLDEHVCELPADKRKQRVTYAFIGFGQVTIEVDPICSCDCEDQQVANSSSCGNRGALGCSVCNCDAGYQGARCECESSDSKGCLNPNSPDGEVCTGRGACSCGRCDCYPSATGVQLYSGDFCECDNTRCPFYLGEPCGGAERGTCSCDETCECKEDYEHGEFSVVERCECPKPDSIQARMACVANYDDSNAPICSGNGHCHCGACICDSGPGSELESPLYEGTYCDVCTGCQTACSNVRACVECLLLGNEQCEVCASTACGDDDACLNSYVQPELLIPEPNSFSAQRLSSSNRLCSYTIQECTHDVLILSNLTGMETRIVLLSNLRLCPAFIQWWYYVLGTIALTVLFGVATLIFIRMLFKYLEHRQYKNFEKEAKTAPFQMGVSPLFVSPDQQIHNPAYQKKMAPKSDHETINLNYQKKLVLL